MKKAGKIILYILGGIILLLVAAILSLRLPVVQQKITSYATNYVSEKTQTKFEIKRLYITFLGEAQIEGLFAEDKNEDTLIYASSILADVAWKPLLNGNVDVKKIVLKGITGKVHNNSADSSFNFQFLIDAFANADSTLVEEEVEATDTTSSTTINVRHILLENIDLRFQDISVEMETRLQLGELELSLNIFDLDSMRFDIEEFLLQNVQANYTQGLAFPPSEEQDTTVSTMPKIQIQKLSLNAINLSYETLFDSLQLSTLIDLLNISDAKVDLAKNEIELDKFDNKISHFRMRLPVSSDSTKEEINDNPAPFEFPDYTIKLSSFNFDLTDLNIKSAGKIKETEGFNPDHMQFQDIKLRLEDAKYLAEDLDIEKLYFSAQDGQNFQLKELSGAINFNASSASLENLKVETANSILLTNASLSFASIDSLFAGSFYQTQFNLNLKLPTTLNIKDAFYFSPALKEDSSLIALSKSPAKLIGKISGDEKAVNLQGFRLLYGNNTSLALNGELKNWQDVDNIVASFENLELKSNVSDFSYFMPTDYPDYYPQRISLSGKADYQNKTLTANLLAKVDQETNLTITALYNQNQPEQYDLDLLAKNMPLDKWLQDSVHYKTADLMLQLKGSGLAPHEMETDAKIRIENFSYLKNEFSPISITASLKENQLQLNTDYTDSIADFSLAANGNIDSLQQKINLKTNIKKLDMYALGITDSSLWLSTNAAITAKFDSLNQKIAADISDLRFISTNQTVYFDLMKLNLQNGSDSSYINFNWEGIHLDMQMNQSFSELGIAELTFANLQNTQLFVVDTTDRPMDIAFNLSATESDNMKDFLPLSIAFDPISAKGRYKSQSEIFEMEMNIPSLSFNDINLDSLKLSFDNSKEEFHINSTFQRLRSNRFDVYPTQIKADILEDKALFNFVMENAEADSLFHVDAIAQTKQDSLFWSIKPENLILNAENWNMHPENAIYFDTANLFIRNLIFERNQQLFSLKTEHGENTALRLNFENFKLENFFAIINAEESPAKGILQGHLLLEDINNPVNFSAGLSLDSLSIFDEAAGNVRLEASQESENRYQFLLTSDGAVTLKSEGWFDNNGEFPEFDLDLVMEKVSLPFMTAFSQGLIKDTEGNLSGNFKLKGSTEKFTYSGNLKFLEASLFFPYLNANYRLPNEEISVVNEQIKFNNFTLIDQEDRKMQLSGNVNTKNLLNPGIDLKLTAENFLLLNTTKEDNELFYGKALVSATIAVTGTANQPTIQAKVGLTEKSNLVYIIPESEVDIVERDGVVTFTKPFDPSDTVNNSQEPPSRNTDIAGVDLNAIITTHKDAVFRVIVDERRGDYLTVSGETDLNFNLRRNGAINLNGNVEISKGYYQLSLYDLVKRRFDIQQGSRITFNGDPMDASLAITALYTVETSANTLMAEQISSDGNQTKFRQKLPFLVQLFVNGNLSQPEISFGLDMPQEGRGAFGGSVYQQVSSINEDETRLNKQVFSLLVLNQFFPAGNSTGGPDSEAIARNSASQILSNQLNKLSSQYVKGVNLNLDLNSYEDYQSGTPQDRTQLDVSLSKNLFNDRFRVEVGSQVDLEGQQSQQQQATDIIGNILIEYLLTEDGRYKLRGYRKNEWEGLLDGQVVVTGISVQYSKEFDKLNELWTKSKEEEAE